MWCQNYTRYILWHVSQKTIQQRYSESTFLPQTSQPNKLTGLSNFTTPGLWAPDDPCCLFFLLSCFEFYQKQKLYAPFVNQFMPEPMFFLVVSGRCGAAICRHDLQTLIQSSNWHFIVKPLTVSHLNWEIIPRVLTLVVLIVIKIHTDWKTAVTAKNKIDSNWVKILLIMKGTRLRLFW